MKGPVWHGFEHLQINGHGIVEPKWLYIWEWDELNDRSSLRYGIDNSLGMEIWRNSLDRNWLITLYPMDQGGSWTVEFPNGQIMMLKDPQIGYGTVRI